jgi:hypothetical protein
MTKVEYIVRVKLPEAGSYPACPSGDTDYEDDFRKAIFAAKPEGFEVDWTTQRDWPKDNRGYTWVKLYVTDKKRAIEFFMNRYEDLRRQHDALVAGLKKLIS